MSGGRMNVVLAAALPAVAGAAVAVLYDSPLLLLLVLLAAVLCAAAPVLGTHRRPGLAAPLALLGLLVLLLLLVITTGGAPPTAVLRELGGSIKRLISYAPPVPTRADTLVPPLVVVWAAAFTAAALAARGRRLLAAAPTVAVLVAALVLVGRAAPVPSWVAPAVAAGVLLLLLDGRRARPGLRRRGKRPGARLAFGTAAVLVVAGLVTAWTIPNANRVDLRAHYQPPEQQPQPIDPLSRLAGWAKGDTQPLATLRFQSGGPLAGQATTWRWAILDRFDGARWTSSLRYRPTGYRLRDPARPIGIRPGATVEATVRVDPTLAPWLPTAGVVRELTGLEIAVGSDHDSVISLGDQNGSAEYGLVAGTGTVDPQTVATLTAGTPPEGQDAAAAPGLPDNLRQIAASFGPGQGLPDGTRALNLERFLRANGEFVTNAPAGHLYLRLGQFFNQADKAYLRGTSEQFATAYAVLARAVGLPTRIVVGFDVPATAGGTVDIAGTDMRAWPEVYFTGTGWLRFDPTPTKRGTNSPHPRPSLSKILPPPPAPASPRPAPTASGRTPGADTRPDNGHVPTSAVSIGLGAGLLALVVLLTGLVTMLRWRLRRRRRGAPDQVQRVIGAWREFEDAADLAGVWPGTPAPATTVATGIAAAAKVSERPSRELARLANAAAFGPAGTVAGHDADRAWATTDLLTPALRHGASRGRRLTWWVRPGPLRRR